MSDKEEGEQSIQLSDRQKARIERNRQTALLLRQSRVANRPYHRPVDKNGSPTKLLAGQSKVIDTGAGFFIDDDVEDISQPIKVKHQPGPILAVDNLLCDDCEKEFVESYLFNSFDKLTCDNCKDFDEKHALITRTDAKNKYLLKDVDFDRREPLLRFILRKNPHNPNWGDMKLYLESQISTRALEVWGSEDKMDEEVDRRNENKEKAKQKKYEKKMKELRMTVRSSLWKKDTGNHEHVYGEEEYDSEEDVYTKTCSTCNHKMTYEKM